LIEDSFQSPVREIHPQVFATIFAKSIVDDEFLGMVVLSLNTEVFARSMRPLLKHDIRTFLFDDRGLVLASAFKSSGYSNLLKELNLNDEASNILTKSSFELEKKEVSYGERRFQFSVLPSESFLSSGGIDRGLRDGEKWFLGVLEPQGSTIVPISFQIFFFSLLFLVVGAVLWVTAKASRRITIPLEKVSAATNKIGRGVSDLKLDIKTGDEVEDLANAVTKMNTDLHDYQKQLVQAAKLATMGEMTSEISHEIQNRISGISLWLQHLDSEVDSDDPRHEYIDEMKQGLGGFMEMLASLKQYYKTPVLDLQDVDLNSVVSETLPFVREKIDQKQVKVDTELDSILPIIEADEEKLKSVVLNILLNAIDSLGERGKIEIISGIDSEKKSVFLEISDSGRGIEEKDLSRIFYPFYSTKSGGSGLGLAISSNIIAAHSGRIEVESEVGKGTTFKIVLKV